MYVLLVLGRAHENQAPRPKLLVLYVVVLFVVDKSALCFLFYRRCCFSSTVNQCFDCCMICCCYWCYWFIVFMSYAISVWPPDQNAGVWHCTNKTSARYTMPIVCHRYLAFNYCQRSSTNQGINCCESLHLACIESGPITDDNRGNEYLWQTIHMWGSLLCLWPQRYWNAEHAYWGWNVRVPQTKTQVQQWLCMFGTTASAVST